MSLVMLTTCQCALDVVIKCLKLVCFGVPHKQLFLRVFIFEKALSLSITMELRNYLHCLCMLVLKLNGENVQLFQ